MFIKIDFNEDKLGVICKGNFCNLYFGGPCPGLGFNKVSKIILVIMRF